MGVICSAELRDAYRVGRVGPGGDEVDLVLLGLLEHPLVAVVCRHFPYQTTCSRKGNRTKNIRRVKGEAPGPAGAIISTEEG